MKGATSQDGKISGNSQLVASHDSAHKKPAPKSEPMQMDATPPEQVVAEHGPAHEVNIKHDHAGGKHHVHSKHESGHEHHSEHGSAHEAHQHGAALAGAGDGMGGEEQQPAGQSHTGQSAGYL